MNDIKVIVSAATRVLCTGLAALALQPVLAEPRVFAVLTQSAEAAVLIGTVAGAVMTVGWAHHKLAMWASQRPVMPAPSQVYAAMAGMPPQLQQTAAQLQAEERQPESDEEHQLYLAVVRFAIIGESRQTFSRRDMRGNVDRPTWDFLTKYFRKCGILLIGSGQRPTWFAEGWTSARVRVALKRGNIPLPDPEGDDPVVVRWNDYRHAMHTR